MVKLWAMVALLAVSQLACNQVQEMAEEPTPETPVNVTESESDPAEEEMSDDRSDYWEMEVSEFEEGHQLEQMEEQLTPRSLMGLILSRPVSLEGRSEEMVTIDYAIDYVGSPPSGTAVVNHTMIGLPDDSVNSRRYRIEMTWDLQEPDADWEVTWVGQQFRCQQGRGQQDWGSDFCI
ncbi:hypothetical protein [Sodalinema gerasimenkoae]|uniref:hypothetical protein n=1 Tax=Sodalinema gerasimenkoae TaxID=2862348 RepID=UPI00135C2865|nr:hypothetical protein [Sodalinema gerasimenkoae]